MRLTKSSTVCSDFSARTVIASFALPIITALTKLTKADGTSVYIPNGKVSDGVVLNYSEKTLRRLDLNFSIAYDADADKAKDLIAAVLLKNTYAFKDPAPLIRIGELSDSAVILHVRVWTTQQHYWDLYYDLHEQIKAAFDANGIQIPFPQMDLHVKDLHKS